MYCLNTIMEKKHRYIQIKRTDLYWSFPAMFIRHGIAMSLYIRII